MLKFAWIVIAAFIIMVLVITKERFAFRGEKVFWPVCALALANLVFPIVLAGIDWHNQSGSHPLRKGGSVSVQGSVAAGDGDIGDGGNATIRAGDGQNGASGGDIALGPGTYRAGNGGAVGDGGDLTIEAGDAK